MRDAKFLASGSLAMVRLPNIERTVALVRMGLQKSAKKLGILGLRSKLVQLALAVLVPVAMFAAWMVQQNVEYTRSQLLASNLGQAQIAASSLDEYFSNILTLLETLARLTVSQEPTLANLKSIYVPALTSRPSLAGIAAVDYQGNLIAGLSWDSSQIRSDPFPLPYWPHGRGRPSVSGRLVWPSTGEGVVGISVPIWETDGTLVGELQAWVPLKQLLLKLDRAESTSIVVVDSAGLILAHPDWSYLDRPVQLTDLYPITLDSLSRASVEEFRSADGAEWVVGHAPTDLHWTVLVMQPGSQLYPPLDDARSRWAVFLSMAVLFAVGLGLFVATRITGPLGELNRAALSLAGGDLSERTRVQSGDELELLGGAFNQMAESLQSTIRQLHDAQHQVERQARTLRLLLARIIRTQEDERARISRELHDEVNQLLIGSLFQVQAAAAMLHTSPPDAATQLCNALGTLNRAVAEVKRVTLNLRPPRLEEGGLVPAIRCLLDEFSATTGIEAELLGDGEPARLSTERETAIYRVVQESLSNIRRHSVASHVSVELHSDQDTLTIKIVDNGRGFVAEAVDLKDNHLGLTGMRERAEGAGGYLRISSELGNGTTVCVTVPTSRRRLRPAPEVLV